MWERSTPQGERDEHTLCYFVWRSRLRGRLLACSPAIARLRKVNVLASFTTCWGALSVHPASGARLVFLSTI